MRNKRTLLCVFVLFAALAPFLLKPAQAFAAADAATVSVNPTTAAPGGTVVATVSASGANISGLKITVSFDSAVFDYSASTVTADCKKSVSGNTVTFTYLHPEGSFVTSKTLGTISLKVKSGLNGGTQGKVSVTFAEVSNTDGQLSTPSMGSSTVTVKTASAASSKAPTPSTGVSSNAALGSLSIDGVTLSPAFSSTIREYAASVPYETTSLKVAAKSADQNAKVTVSGHQNLKVGLNYVVIKVTAPNGTVRQYNVTVTRQASGSASSAADSALSAASSASAGSGESAESVDGSSGDPSSAPEDVSALSSEEDSSSAGLEAAAPGADLSGWAIHAGYIGGMIVCLLLGCMLGYYLRGRKES